MTNNLFYGLGRVYPNGEDGCVWIGSAHDNSVTSNECSDSYGGGIAVGPNPGVTNDYEYNNTITLNNIHDIGEGVISDFGCVHFANFGGSVHSNLGDLFKYNICRDITHDVPGAANANVGDVANGGTGIYIDNNSQNVTAMDNLVYRTSGALFFNNGSPNCNQTSSGIPSCKNNVQSNILAYSLQGPIKRGTDTGSGDTLQDFTFQNNIIYFGANQMTSSGPQWLGNATNSDFWDCGISNLSTPPPCTSYFNFLSNGYYSPSLTFNLPAFVTVNVVSSSRTLQYWYGLPQWQTTADNLPGEDQSSGGMAVYANPNFTDPSYIGNNFQFQNNSVPTTIGFDLTNFTNYTYNAGRTTIPLLLVPARVAPTFPLTLPSPVQF